VHDISVIAYFLMQIINPLENLAVSTGKFRAACNELGQVIDLLDKKENEAKKLPLILTDPKTEIKFDHVGFSYQGKAESKVVLNDISFDVKTGETIGIVGPTGGGKTTIARLLLRFFNPTQGKILINNQDITEVDIASLRNILSIVPQSPVLFDNTLRYNIAYGAYSITDDLEITDDEILKAIKLVQLEDFVKNSEEGLDTLVGERGLKLSGGELLRVAIARAIIRKPRIIILDEYTAALDSETESAIYKELKSELHDTIKIIIALILQHFFRH
jgi:ATP-binding cassette subfamily B protein